MERADLWVVPTHHKHAGTPPPLEETKLAPTPTRSASRAPERRWRTPIFLIPVRLACGFIVALLGLTPFILLGQKAANSWDPQ